MTSDVIETIQGRVEDFNRRVAVDEGLSNDLADLHRTILLDLDGTRICLELKDGRLEIIDDVDPADITVRTTPEVLMGIFNGEIGVMRALLIDRTLKIEASLQDKLRLRKLFE